MPLALTSSRVLSFHPNARAGSLTNLAKAPASTVQILGAEKALFRALKTKGNTPKYGLIFHSSFIGRAKQRNKGRISRYLANKCSIATRIDAFMDAATPVFGEKMKEQARAPAAVPSAPFLSPPTLAQHSAVTRLLQQNKLMTTSSTEQ